VHELPPPTVVWLSLQQAAERTGFSTKTIQRAMSAGELEYSGGNGYRIRIRTEVLDDWLAHRGRSREVD
jgi:excisionase family DNA binding protein